MLSTFTCYLPLSHLPFASKMPPTTRSKKSKGNGLHRSGSLVVNIFADKMDNQQTTSQVVAVRRFPREIPDSQEDPTDLIISDNDGADTEVDGEPAETEKAILRWLKENTPKEKPRYVSLVIETRF